MGSYRGDGDKDKARCPLVTNNGCLLCVCHICLLHVSAQRDHLKVNTHIKITKTRSRVVCGLYINEVPFVQSIGLFWSVIGVSTDGLVPLASSQTYGGVKVRTEGQFTLLSFVFRPPERCNNHVCRWNCVSNRSFCVQVIMGDRPAAERACKDPNPIIDGRKANVNLAILGAKPRGNIQPG
jgi:hypothetical protein